MRCARSRDIVRALMDRFCRSPRFGARGVRRICPPWTDGAGRRLRGAHLLARHARLPFIVPPPSLTTTRTRDSKLRNMHRPLPLYVHVRSQFRTRSEANTVHQTCQLETRAIRATHRSERSYSYGSRGNSRHRGKARHAFAHALGVFPAHGGNRLRIRSARISCIYPLECAGVMG